MLDSLKQAVPFTWRQWARHFCRQYNIGDAGVRPDRPGDGPTNFPIRTWEKFHRQIRTSKQALLYALSQFPEAILIGGCQRSGTTMLTRLITSHPDIYDFSFLRDEELAAALVLSGHSHSGHAGRRCFQTTYLNERYVEYFAMPKTYKLIWLFRNPSSVVRSMLYNWADFPRLELYSSCGEQLDDGTPAKQCASSSLLQACSGYNGKIKQALTLWEKLPREQILFIEYEAVIKNSEVWIPKIFSFVGLSGAGIALPGKTRSSMIIPELTEEQKMTIRASCEQSYKKARERVLS